MVHISTEAGGGGAGAAPVVGEEPDGGVESGLSPDRTPTNEAPSTPLQSGETNSLHLSQNKLSNTEGRGLSIFISLTKLRAIWVNFTIVSDVVSANLICPGAS